MPTTINVPKPPPIDVPRPQLTDDGCIKFATEVAFSSLVQRAGRLGLKLNPVMGLVYLPDEQVAAQFQEACKAVIHSLVPVEPDRLPN